MMNNEDKIKDFQEWLSKMTEEFSEFTKPDEPEFKEGDWLEFSDFSFIHSITYTQLSSVSPESSNPFRARNFLYYKHARRPYDRIIPHNGGPMPEWINGKRVTLWSKSNSTLVTKSPQIHSFEHVKEYRVHKEES